MSEYRIPRPPPTEAQRRDATTRIDRARIRFDQAHRAVEAAKEDAAHRAAVDAFAAMKSELDAAQRALAELLSPYPPSAAPAPASPTQTPAPAPAARRLVVMPRPAPPATTPRHAPAPPPRRGPPTSPPPPAPEAPETSEAQPPAEMLSDAAESPAEILDDPAATQDAGDGPGE